MSNTAATDTVQRNKALVLDFYAKVCNARSTALLGDFIADDYIEHNPGVEGGRAAVAAFLNQIFSALPDISFTVARVAAEGDLVMVHFLLRRTSNDRGTAVVDIFRIAGGKLAEHWDVMAPLPEDADGKLPIV